MATRSPRKAPPAAAAPAPKPARRAASPAARQDIAQELRRRIAAQALAPGTKLTELDLAAEFGVPRPRIRDALSLLEERGLVERTPNKGAVVTRLNLEQAMAIYEAREALEGTAVRLATERGPKTVWKALHKRFLDEMPVLLRDARFDELLDGYEEFRLQVLAAAGNPVVQSMLDSILERTHMVMRRAVILPGRAERGLAQHQAVLLAMGKGQPEEAERLRREHLREAAEFVRRYHRFII